MEIEKNVEEALAEARANVMGIELKGFPQELDAYRDMLWALVEVVENEPKKQNDEQAMTAMADEFLHYAEALTSYDHMFNALYSVSKRMAAAYDNYPKEKLRLLEFHLKVVDRINDMNGGRGNLADFIREDIERLKSSL